MKTKHNIKANKANFEACEIHNRIDKLLIDENLESSWKVVRKLTDLDLSKIKSCLQAM